MKIDFNNLPGKPSAIGDPHWLSGSGKVDRKGNHDRRRAEHLASLRALPPKPARPETTAKLEAVSRRIKNGIVFEPEPESADHEHDSHAWDKHRARGVKKKLKIYGHGLATWARAIHSQDAQRIFTAISVGLSAGEDNTDIAHRVIGGRRHNGANGMTEVTRQHIYRLGHGLLHKRKTRMRGAGKDV